MREAKEILERFEEMFPTEEQRHSLTVHNSCLYLTIFFNGKWFEFNVDHFDEEDYDPIFDDIMSSIL